MSGIKTRFDQPRYGIYTNLENLLLKTASGGDFSNELSTVCEFLRELLETRLTILKTKAQGNALTSVSSIITLPNANGRALFSEIATAVKLILVMPATNASSERPYTECKYGRPLGCPRTSCAKSRLVRPPAIFP